MFRLTQQFLDTTLDEILFFREEEPPIQFAQGQMGPFGRFLRESKILTIRDLAVKTQAELLKNNGIGRKRSDYAGALLNHYGLRFGMTEAELAALPEE